MFIYRSFVWKYFLKKESKSRLVVEYMFCNKSLKVREDRSTSSFRKHLASQHKNKVPELKTSNISQGITVLDMLNNNNVNRNYEPFDSKILTDLIKKWVIKYNWSFHIIEDEGFKDILTYLEPRTM
ncbi:9633_t:CDS:2, partial [Dentiscutata erythropus]